MRNSRETRTHNPVLPLHVAIHTHCHFHDAITPFAHEQVSAVAWQVSLVSNAKYQPNRVQCEAEHLVRKGVTDIRSSSK